MSDLIGRSELIKEIEKYKFGAISNDAEREYVKDTILNFIICQPTAYDIDKVVEELEQNKRKLFSFAKDYDEVGDFAMAEIYSQRASEYITAIEIVKQGCVTYDCNNCANYTEPDEIDNGCYLCCKGYENNYKPKVDNGGVSDDVCEWKPDKDFDGMYKACSGDVTYLKGFKYCPYCGKKIKVVE